MSLVSYACTCTPSPDYFFSFPLSSAILPEASVPICPNLLSEIEFPLSNYRITDSILVAYEVVKGFGLTAFSVNTGDTLVNLCRKGRGPNENLLIAPYYDIVDGIAGIIDTHSSKYQEINIPESVRTGMTVIDREVALLNTCSPILYTSSLVGEDSLLCYDVKANVISKTLTGIPGFSLFNLEDGRTIAEFPLVADKPIRLRRQSPHSVTNLFHFYNCLVLEHNCVCIAFSNFPVIAFFDYKEGAFRGMKIEGMPEFNQMKYTFYFSNPVYAYGSIYVLYHGVPFDNWIQEGNPSQIHSKILKLDLSGNIRGYYELDDIYSDMSFSNDLLYLAKTNNNRLYTIDVVNLR